MTTTDIRRAIGTLLVAAVGGWLLLQLPSPSAPPTEIRGLIAWWESTGTDAAAMAFARVVMLGVCGYVAVISAIALVDVPLRLVRIRLPWHRLALPSLRRHLAGATIVAVTLAPGLASAQESGGFTASDIGRAAQVAELVGPFTVVDIGKTPMADVDTAPASTPSANTHTWTVRPGDHLWGIASAQVWAANADGQGGPVDNQSIAHYWTRLIDANADQLNGNPDIIFAGQILALPPVAQR